jgi:hypothetical protein
MAKKAKKAKKFQQGGMVSPRKQMAMGNQMDMGADINPRNVGQAMQMGREIAAAMAKPRADVTGMNAGSMDRTMGVQRAPMSSGRMRPQMRRNRLV